VRAGIEGWISRLKRRFELDRCRTWGEAGLERWVGCCLSAHFLRQSSTNGRPTRQMIANQYHHQDQPAVRVAWSLSACCGYFDGVAANLQQIPHPGTHLRTRQQAKPRL
jgi:hypothetical protein